MKIHILTLFPKEIEPLLNFSILSRAQINKKVKILIYNLRDYACDKHQTVDDKAYGGGAGMILKADVVENALVNILKNIKSKNRKVILTDPRGKTYTQTIAKKYSKIKDLIIICGHYGGVDERVNNFVDESISIGNYVLTGGEIPALAITDSIIRLLPGTINKDSLKDETFTNDINKQFSQYTRPAKFYSKLTKETLSVPDVLLSGNHSQIENWRKEKSK